MMLMHACTCVSASDNARMLDIFRLCPGKNVSARKDCLHLE